MSSKLYLPGLTPLRFFAASLVVLDHGNYQLEKFGFDSSGLLLFNRGFEAVTFFFVLSGFLITYLLIREVEDTKTINVTTFYLKRVKRIWPLYFIVIIAGLILYNLILPATNIDFEVDYKVGQVIPLFIFFMANLAYSFFNMGGALAITWSIGIEEQFYLVWAPMVKKYFHRLLPILVSIYSFWALVHLFNDLKIFDLSYSWRTFIGTMQFHCMALGGIGAYYAYYYKEKLTGFVWFSKRSFQIALLVFLISLFAIWNWHLPRFVVMQILPLLFLWLIVDTSINPKPLLNLEINILHRLGEVSYGIYMLHYFSVYLVIFVLSRYFHELYSPLMNILYYLAIFGITIFTANISFKYLELPFLKIKFNEEQIRSWFKVARPKSY